MHCERGHTIHSERVHCERVHCERVHCERVHCERVHCERGLACVKKSSRLREGERAHNARGSPGDATIN